MSSSASVVRDLQESVQQPSMEIPCIPFLPCQYMRVMSPVEPWFLVEISRHSEFGGRV